MAEQVDIDFEERDPPQSPLIGGKDGEDELNDWLCVCGHYETSGLHCSCCGYEPPWGCDCSLHDEEDDEEDYTNWFNQEELED